MRLPDSAERLQSLQNAILEAIARGEPLAAIMATLCRRVEAIAPGVTCSVLAVDDDGRLQPLAAPSLPDFYAEAIRGVPVGPKVGSCGTAIHRKRPVEVKDIATDPLWEDYRELVIPLGLRACWSSPIMARDGRVTGSFAFYYDQPRGATAFERRIVATCAHLCAIAIEHEEVSARNHRLAYFDTLTGLPNRASFNQAIAQITGAASAPFGLMLIDIDHLKAVNDTMGHAAGDAVLLTVAQVLTASAREVDVIGRLGGEEFGVLLPRSEQMTVRRAADRLRQMLGDAETTWRGQPIRLTVSIGAALCNDADESPTQLLERADHALYQAKNTGRNRTVVARLATP